MRFQAYRVDGDLRRRRFAERQSASMAGTRFLARLVRRPGFDLFFSLASWILGRLGGKASAHSEALALKKL